MPRSMHPLRRILTFTSLFPSPARPRHGIFVQTRLLQLLREHPLDVRVVAPVPWFPFAWPVCGSYAAFAATPRHSVAHGLRASYPRYAMVPGIGMAWQPDALARAALADIARWRAEGWTPDLIDAHYLYPDGVAAAIVAERLGLPFVMTARGTDVNVIARMPGPGRRIRWAAERARTVIAVSTRLKESLIDLGVDAARVAVLRNGVDPDLFHPEDRASARAALGLPAEEHVAVCVGNLVPEKGFDLAIEAVSRSPGWRLVLAGDGPMKVVWSELARRLGAADRVHFMSAMPQAQLRGLYSAADVLLLTSTREGWPNVVLEALACGTPVVATDVGAVNEMLTDPVAGRVVGQRDAGAIAQAMQAVVAPPPSRDTIRRHAISFDWSSISHQQMDIFSRAVSGHPTAVPGVAPSGRPTPHPR